jgi:hypothetical protein
MRASFPVALLDSPSPFMAGNGKGGVSMKAILNRAMAVPTVRWPFGYSLYLGATVLFSATPLYAQGMPSNCRWGWIDADQTQRGWVCN